MTTISELNSAVEPRCDETRSFDRWNWQWAFSSASERVVTVKRRLLWERTLSTLRRAAIVNNGPQTMAEGQHTDNTHAQTQALCLGTSVKMKFSPFFRFKIKISGWPREARVGGFSQGVCHQQQDFSSGRPAAWIGIFPQPPEVISTTVAVVIVMMIKTARS